MKVRFFTADSIQDAMAQVKNVLGRDAIILHTRTFRKGGVFGFFGKEKVEVMAAIDTPTAPVIEKKVQPSVPIRPKVQSSIDVILPSVPILPIIEESIQTTVQELVEPAVPIPPVEKEILPMPAVEEDKNLIAVQRELTNMRTLLEQVLDKESPKIKKTPTLEFLINNDIESHIAEEIISSIPATSADDDALVSQEFKKKFLAQVEERIQGVQGIEVSETGRNIVAFIGPTGVGKTTTIAKLAAKFAMQDKCSVALITADTYRVSAVEQLKTYSDIMGIPIYVVYTGDELKRVLDSNLDKQLILIDTAGRSPHNEDQLDELEKLLTVDASIEKHLVLSATTKYKDALDIVEKFSRCLPYKVIVTKTDEARNIGTIINLLYQTPISLSYMTNGQNVPDDIELVDIQKLEQLIFRDE